MLSHCQLSMISFKSVGGDQSMGARQNVISLGVFALLSTLILPYQNCSVPPTSNSLASESFTQSSGAESQPIPSLKAANYQQIEIPKSRLNDSRLDRAVSLFNIDLAQRRVEGFDSERRPVMQFCLNEKVFVEISKLLSSDSFCELKVKPQSQRICSMQYVPPYAVLHNGAYALGDQSGASEAEVKLGEKRDGCGSGLVKLCQNDTALQKLLEELEQNIAQYSCDKAQ